MKYTQDQERGWELERRIRCHGHTGSCLKTHLPITTRRSAGPTIKAEREPFNKLLKFLKIK